jgi:hypothetical protein
MRLGREMKLLQLVNQSLGCHANIFGNLTQQDRRAVPTSVERNCGGPAVDVPKLLVGTAMAYFDEAQTLEDSHNLTRLEDWKCGHDHLTTTL